MKRNLIILTVLAILMAIQGTAQDIDSLYNVYNQASRREKADAMRPLFYALVDEGSINEADTIALCSDEGYLSAILHKGLAFHYYSEGDYASGLAHAEEGLPHVPADSLDLRDDFLSFVSVLAFYLSDYDKALEACEQRLAILPDDDVVNRASVCNTLASIYFDISNNAMNKASDKAIIGKYNEQALHFSQEAVALRRQLGNDEGGLLAAFLGKQSEILSGMGKTDEAIAILDEAMALDLEAGRTKRYYNRLAQKGNALLMSHRYEEARDALSESLQHTNKERNAVSYKNILFQLGCVEGALDDKKAAIAYFEEYLAVNQDMGSPDVTNVCRRLATCYRDIDPAKAYDYFDRYVRLSDSLRDVELMTQVNDFQVKYETAEKERQLAEQQVVIERRGLLLRTWAIIAIVLIIGIMAILWFALRYRRQSHELQRLNDTKSRLFGIISHDLKNPVQAQKRVIDLLANPATAEKLSVADVQQSCAMLKQSSDSVNDMLLNLLQWASLEMGKTTYTPTRIDLGAVAQSVAAQLRLQAEQKGVEIKVEVPSDTCVTADLNLMTTIVRNLVSNAIKFSNSGSSVEIVAEPRGEGYRLVVVDHGVGMSDEKRQSLFNLSSRSSAGTSGEKGTGLGLFVCQELAQRMGTAIEVESAVGKGSRFSMVLTIA